MKPIENRALTAERLRALLNYDPESGVFTMRVRTRYRRVGDVATKPQLNGSTIYLEGETYKSNRLAWLYMTGGWPAGVVDHRDRNSHNDAWRNLRDVTGEQNAWNRGMHRGNTSGYTGVVYVKRRKKWAAQIRIKGKNKELGVYATPEEAHTAYLKKAKELRGEFVPV